MKKLSAYLFCCLLFTFSFQLAKAEICRLTLKDAINAVEGENLQVLLNREKVEEALQSLYYVRGNLLPNVSLIANQQRTKGAVPINSGGQSDIFFATNIVNSANIQIKGHYSVVDLRKIANYQLAKMGYEISILAYEALKQEVMAEVVKAYFFHQRNIKRMRAIESNINRDQTLLEMTKYQLQAGTASPIDVTRSQVRLSSDFKEKVQQETVLLQSEMSLKQLLDLDLNLKLQLERDPNEASPQNYEPSISFAFNNRYDLSQAECQLEKNLFDCKSSNWDYFPKLEAGGNIGRTSATAFDNKSKETWTIGLGLSMPIFDGFKIHSNYLKAKASVRAQQYAVKELKNEIMANMMVNQQELASAYKQIHITQEQVQLGERELEFAKIRFESGAADNLEVIKAQADLTSFQDALVDAEYNYDLSRLNWAHIHGCIQLLLQNP